MALFPDDGRMKPILIIPPGQVSETDIKLLRENGLCVVEAKEPATIKFLDPIPAMAGRTKVEDTAIKLSRKILDARTFRDSYTGNVKQVSRSDLTNLFVDLIVEGTPLDPEPSQAEFDKRAYDQARTEEMRKIAREDARKEAAKRKAEKEAEKKAKA